MVSSGGTTPVISMAGATSSINGYLKATDWVIFNSKQAAGTYATGTGSASGTNTGDQVLPTLATLGAQAALGFTPYNATNPSGYTSNVGTVTAVTGTAPIVSSGGAAPALSMAAATTSVNGYLTSTDWTTFNSKQAAGTYATGTGSASGTNTGDETLATIKTKLGVTTLSGSNTGDQTLPTTLPASDVYAWAKALTKPTYTHTEVGAQAAGTYATGTGSASGVNTGDQVIPVASSTAPAALGVAAVGVGTTFARADHVHLQPSLATLGAQAAFTSQTANFHYAAPSGSAGVPAFRALTALDVPTLNQNTTGTAATITGVYSGTITASQVTTGLTFTPYNATNPSSYVSQAGITALPLSQLASTLDMGTVP